MGKKRTEHIIKEVAPDSIAWELELVPGDVVLSVNDQPIEDIFDYQYLINEEYLTLQVRKTDGEEWELEIEKEFEDDLGITFESSLMDEYRSCRNHCIFCFIDQMPKGMRDTLYFKDDDSRLSFLQGNYVTLTNMSDHDIDRIIQYHMEPINISFHTMNPALRREMLRNRFAGDIFPKVRRLADAGIEMNGQIVLCRGINDGEELEYSIQELVRYLPQLRSVSVVPVGLTKFREGLYPLKAFTPTDACRVIDCIEHWQKELYAEYGLHFIHASDEWYILAGRDFPEAGRYDGYLQLENGVGMMRLLHDEVVETLDDIRSERTVCDWNPDDTGENIRTGFTDSGSVGKDRTTYISANTDDKAEDSAAAADGKAEDSAAVADGKAEDLAAVADGKADCSADAVDDRSDFVQRKVSIATGRLAGPFLRRLCDSICELYPNVVCSVYEIRNDFFGEEITVSGLITGTDLKAQLMGKDLGDELLLPCTMLRSGENVFLDDVRVDELEGVLQAPIRIVKSEGSDFVHAVTGNIEE
ncbi:MAG: DUF512 domain-containing protein [Lachnospiraceae bacterium]|nr:DUF512 domain-containing protein [Lachnospiraceae bacterium]